MALPVGGRDDAAPGAAQPGARLAVGALVGRGADARRAAQLPRLP